MRLLSASALCVISLLPHSFARIAAHVAPAKAAEAVRPPLSEHNNVTPIGPSFSCPQDNGTIISQLISTERFDYLVLCDFDFPDDDTLYHGLSYDSFSECTAACSAADALFDESFCAVAVYYDHADDNGHNCILKPSTSSGSGRPGVHAAILQAVALAVDHSLRKDESSKFIGLNTPAENEALSSSVKNLLGAGSSTRIALITPPPLLVQRQAPIFTAFTTVINQGSTFSTGTEFHTYFTSAGSWYSAYYSAWSVAWTAATTVYAVGAQTTAPVIVNKTDTTVLDQGPGGYVTVINTTTITYTYTPTYAVINTTDVIISSSFFRNNSFISAQTSVIVFVTTSYYSGNGSSGGGSGGGSGGIISGLLSGSSTLLTFITTANTNPGTTGGGVTLLPSQTADVVFSTFVSIPTQSVPSDILYPSRSIASVIVNTYGTAGSAGGFTGGLITFTTVTSLTPSVIVSSFQTGGSAGTIISGAISATTTPNPPFTVIVSTFNTAGSIGTIVSGAITPGTVQTSPITVIVTSFNTGGNIGSIGSGLITPSVSTPTPLTVIVSSFNTGGSLGSIDSGRLSVTSIPTTLAVSTQVTTLVTGGSLTSVQTGVLTPSTAVPPAPSITFNSFGTGGSTGGLTGGPLTVPSSLSQLTTLSSSGSIDEASLRNRTGIQFPSTTITPLSSITINSFGTGGSTGGITGGPLTAPSSLSQLTTLSSSGSIDDASLRNRTGIQFPSTTSSIFVSSFVTGGSTGTIISGPIPGVSPSTPISLPTTTPVVPGTLSITSNSLFTAGSTGGITSGNIPGISTSTSLTIGVLSSITLSSVTTTFSTAPSPFPSSSTLQLSLPTSQSIGISSFNTFGSTGTIISGPIPGVSTSSTAPNLPPPFTGPSYPFPPPPGSTTTASLPVGLSSTTTPTGSGGSQSLPSTSTATFSSDLRTPGPFTSSTVASPTSYTGPLYPFPTPSTPVILPSSSIPSAPPSVSTLLSSLAASTTLPQSSSSSTLESSTGTYTPTGDLRTRRPDSSSSSTTSTIPTLPPIPTFPGGGGYFRPSSSVPDTPLTSVASSTVSLASSSSLGTGSVSRGSTTNTGSATSRVTISNGERSGPDQFPPTMTMTSPSLSMTGTVTGSPPQSITTVGSATCALATTTVFTTVTLYGCFSQCPGGYLPPQAFGAGPGI